MNAQDNTYWQLIWKQFYKRPLGRISLYLIILFCTIGVYAPFLAASKPLIVDYDGQVFFPLFRYLFYRGYYTKGLDIFFNLLIFTLPLLIGSCYQFRRSIKKTLTVMIGIIFLQGSLFIFFIYGPMQDPATSKKLSEERQLSLKEHPLPSWDLDLKYMNSYAKLNLIIHYQQIKLQHERLVLFLNKKQIRSSKLPTIWQQNKDNEDKEIERMEALLANHNSSYEDQLWAKAYINYFKDRRNWIENQLTKIHYEVMPLVRPFHWEDDAGGSQSLNSKINFLELSRINHSDFVAALIFGVRISLVVGILAVCLSLIIGLPIGALAGFYGGSLDIFVCRLIEIWEAIPTFFILLMVVAILESKSIFLIIAVIGLFGWPSFSRYLRGEFLKQRSLPYIEACRSLGFKDSYIIFSHILPNAIPPILTILPFAIMGAITSEAGLSFLGLGEEGSCSWGVLMDEGRTAFPSASFLLWPPAILLTILLIAIALVGDAFRDALDPKTQKN